MQACDGVKLVTNHYRTTPFSVQSFYLNLGEEESKNDIKTKFSTETRVHSCLGDQYLQQLLDCMTVHAF